MAYEAERQLAIEAATLAAQLCETIRWEIVPTALEKDDRSPVTIADFGAQAIICRALAAAFPEDPVVGEEDAAELRQSDRVDILQQVTAQVQRCIPEATPADVLDWIDHGNGAVGQRYWTLDPIDGTKGFLRGDQYAIALALIENGDIKVGVLACPALQFENTAGSTAENTEAGLLLVAVRGEGAQLMPLSSPAPQPIQVTTAVSTGQFRFVESVEASHGNQAQQSAVAQAVGITQPSIRMDSQAKYAAVAAGQAVLYLRLPSPKTPDYREKIWDHAAGVILVEEAGGQVTDMHGQPLDFSKDIRLNDNRGVVVSNGAIHATVLAALAQTASPTL
ncbi:3'(2'),5'-bisphosphate nucleotidase [Pseudanabaena sp. FACHB-2040]|uniref:3'(2'),5'-bisphosphate nucleotidase n=1 Tax=Pseudanabaena sp. FACHB-2040 TaxID=2692859 RepID=UPI001681FFE7|nr:3'(2'),5'-bisphosphate nucleotidase [Pseudanabaena sp. FACHB-2040]MBD2260142.1 3'(2'),5'-bisphosphate nucleotidase [Pseudanabaena sp. FACHB-2040]